MNSSTSIDPPAAELVEARGADDDGGMNRFAALLDRLAYVVDAKAAHRAAQGHFFVGFNSQG